MNLGAARSVTVVGAGIVGLAVARELALRYEGVAVTVLDKEPRVAAHQSGHNSGVVHAGLYYAPGSLKAELCRRGGSLLRAYCAEHSLPYRELGKLVVASDETELSGLASIEQRAHANGVPDLRRVGRSEMADIEPNVRGVAGLHSPHTASVDYVAICESLAADLRHAGGTVMLGTKVLGASDRREGVVVRHTQGDIRADALIVCAGLTGDFLATRLGLPDDMRVVPFRGEYYELTDKAAGMVRGMIYPVPDPRYPFLGVHLTRGVDDHVHVGPNAVMATALEGYRRRDVKARDVAHLAGWPGTWRLARTHWRNGMSELAGSVSTRRYLKQVRRYVPAIERDDLRRSTAGVRAQQVARSGALIDDFAIRTTERVWAVRNAPSPAATSSLAIAEHVVALIERG
jgi:(S)-2-hydroxyglutarate dehydrogenase